MVLLVVRAASATVIAAPPVRRDFEADAIGSPPAGFEFGRTGRGAEGKWVVRVEKGADKRHVLVQERADPRDYRFPLAVLKDSAYKDVTLSSERGPCRARSVGDSAWSGGTGTPTTTTSRGAPPTRTTARSTTPSRAAGEPSSTRG